MKKSYDEQQEEIKRQRYLLEGLILDIEASTSENIQLKEENISLQTKINDLRGTLAGYLSLQEMKPYIKKQLKGDE